MNQPTPPQPSPQPKPRAKRGFIDQALEDDMELASNCHREAGKPEIAPQLLEREWTAAEQTALGESIVRCEKLVTQIEEARTGKKDRTKEEKAAQQELLVALDPIIKGARRTHPDGSADRVAYGLGAGLSNAAAGDLLRTAKYTDSQLAPGENNAPPKAVLKGVKSDEIAAISALVVKYKNADWAQGDAQKKASELLAQLRAEIEGKLNPARRDLQGAADQAYTHRNALNGPQRQAFGLQANRPLND